MSPFYLGKVGAMNVLKTEFVINDNGPGVTAADEGVVVYVPTNEKKCPRHLMVAVPTVRGGEGRKIIVEAKRRGEREKESSAAACIYYLPYTPIFIRTRTRTRTTPTGRSIPRPGRRRPFTLRAL